MASHTPRVGFVSLGCPKAGSDSERILTQLRAEGYDISKSYQDADLVVVNTCGFIDSAVKESMDAIGEAVKKNGKVIVTGCLGAKKDIIEKEYPNLLAITGPHALNEVMSAVHTHLEKPHDPFSDLVPPQGMRGDLVSRSIDDVMTEAETLVNSGVSEILVISQDTSAYGVDIKYRSGFWNGRPIKTKLYDLAEALGSLGVWIRMHYVYPYPHVDDIIPLMSEGSILPYLDVPFQHASPRILKLMKRPASSENNLLRINKWREVCPDITIRSTFIVGFPGETEAEFEALLDFLEEAQLDRVGCFKYSPVDGASANLLEGHVPEEIKEERLQKFMETQARISHKKLQAKVGQTLTVLVDSHDGDYAIARSMADAPDIDGKVFLRDGKLLKPGDFVDVKIESYDQHDLFAGPNV